MYNLKILSINFKTIKHKNCFCCSHKFNYNSKIWLHQILNNKKIIKKLEICSFCTKKIQKSKIDIDKNPIVTYRNLKENLFKVKKKSECELCQKSFKRNEDMYKVQINKKYYTICFNCNLIFNNYNLRGRK